MADRRGVRSASQRKTPTPQPPSKANTPPRRRALRSASRDVEPPYEALKPARRSARQASVATLTEDSEQEGHPTRRTRRRLAKEAMADLTVVEEADPQIDLQEAPGTPKHMQLEHPAPFLSPGAASEMSGTTAISSFTMVEAEFLEPKYILKHLPKLCETAREFLEHLAPDNGSLEGDLHNIHETQKPGSDFNDEYQDFDDQLNVHLKHFKSEQHSYIRVRAIHRVLFPANPDLCATESGLDLILYMSNLLVFAKQMIHSDRSDKQIWDALRYLDSSFPSQFMRSLEHKGAQTSTGDSRMLTETFDLALELRTQLAILVLENSATDINFNPDEAILEVFYRSEVSQEDDDSLLRGWNMPALGGEDSALPQQLENHVISRLEKIRQFFPGEDESLERGDFVDIEGLGTNFPWEATILRLLHWVRHRHREIFTNIDQLGGPATITRRVKQLIEEPPVIAEQPKAISKMSESPRRKRASFTRDRRRSSRKFDPNAPIDLEAIDILKSRERLSGASTAQEAPESPNLKPTIEETLEENQDELPVMQDQNGGSQPVVGQDIEEEHVDVEEEHADVEEEHTDVEEKQADGQLAAMMDVEEDYVEQPDVAVSEAEIEAGREGPPTSSAALLKALKKVKPQKENRTASIFDRQPGAQTIEFGDGFDTQPTPGPSTRDKGKQRAQPLRNKKRPRSVAEESESEDNAFEAEDRTARAQERRQQAPVAKKVRISPTLSAAPTSHQPPPRPEVDDDYVLRQPRRRPVPNESISEDEAPDMTEEAPPSSTYEMQRNLAKQNAAVRKLVKPTERRPRTMWTTDEVSKFTEYMKLYPAKYAAILVYDRDHGYEVLQERSQVDLKDKARTMAVNMIKSGTGLMPGFEDIVKPDSAIGKSLIAQGFEW